MISFKDDKAAAAKEVNHANSPPTSGKSQKNAKGGDDVSSFIWRTFVGNKKKEDFFKSAVILLILINGVLVFFLYNQKIQKSVYVIDAGVPKLANLIDSNERVDEQVVFFVKLWTQMLTEINSDNYSKSRESLKGISTQSLMKRVLTAESATSNRLVKELIQSETMRLRNVDLVIDGIERQGSLITVRFSEVLQIDLPSGSERYVTSHVAQVMPTNYSLNGIGLVMVDMDNLWKLERRIE